MYIRIPLCLLPHSVYILYMTNLDYISSAKFHKLMMSRFNALLELSTNVEVTCTVLRELFKKYGTCMSSI